MADKSTNLDILDKRIEAVENIVFGGTNKDAVYPKDDEFIGMKCIDSLTNVHNKISAVAAGKKRIPQVYVKLPELEKYLDPSYSEDLTTSVAAKQHIIIAAEEFVEKQVKDLEQMSSLQGTLDSEHIKAVPLLSKKLKDLCQVHLKQQDQASELTEETRKLMAQYNSIINLLSKQFVKWDETLTQLEISSQPKKPID